MDRFGENEIKEAFDRSSQGIKDVLLGSTLVSEMEEIAKMHSLAKEDVGQLIKELGYLGLGLAKEQNDYSNLIKNSVENIDKSSDIESFIKMSNDYFKETYKKFLELPGKEIKYYETNEYLVTSKRFFDKSRQNELDIMDVDFYKINSLGFGGAIGSVIMMFIGALLLGAGGFFAIVGLVLIGIGVFAIMNRNNYYVGQKDNIDVTRDSISKKIATDMFPAIAKAQVKIMDKNSAEFDSRMENI
jgi:hypothetical protein